ncbi:hypothetical protein RRG08_036989 [Elysia crispata]|uniref:Uncharacterized protein n=1 Tax=Elysia crispata TaxID=231223 RepID=A0AAE1CM68_9GAST|nr:hypothetical protein RRG08_036989 [Elysia crispata]
MAGRDQEEDMFRIMRDRRGYDNPFYFSPCGAVKPMSRLITFFGNFNSEETVASHCENKLCPVYTRVSRFPQTCKHVVDPLVHRPRDLGWETRSAPAQMARMLWVFVWVSVYVIVRQEGVSDLRQMNS